MNTREPDHLNLLCDIGDLAAIVTADSGIESFLDGAAGLVAKHLKAHVCSIYLFDGSAGNLTLSATRGLNPNAVKQVRMAPGEGLVGQCFSEDRILREGNARATPGFKYFAAAGEEPFNSFLCVPIRRGVEKIGVLVVQHREIDHFTYFDERALKTAATQLGSAVENARLILALPGVRPDRANALPPGPLPLFVRGRSDRSGVAWGVIRPSRKNRKAVIYEPDTSGRSYTLAEFKTALEKTTRELKGLQDKFAASLPESAALIFTAHFMMLRDKKFTGRMAEEIRAGRPAVDVIQARARKYIRIFSESPHAYLREKAVDVEDLSIRLLTHLKASGTPAPESRGSIVVAEELYPSDILKLTADGIRGIVLVGGGTTSHVTILARSLDIPLIIADDPLLLQLPETTRLLLDTDQGNVYINPDPKTLDLFTARQEAETRRDVREVQEKTLTRDGKRIRLLANINLLSEIRLAKDLKAEGVGLYRTEFPFLIRPAFPSEDEQYLIYKKLFDETDGGQVITVRTLDAGGEKALSYAGSAREANPVLGLRSIRFALRYREVFDTQVRAILRAAYGRRNVRLMFPLISSIDEFLEARQVVGDCAAALRREGVPCEPDIEVGMMVELPSVLPIIDELAGLADFFAIGTNDFIQYMVGADRANKLVADHYLAHHPAVLRGIQTIADAAVKQGIDVSVCGEMAHDPVHIPFLVGAGITVLSVDPKFIPQVQNTISALRMTDARAYARTLLAQTRISGAAEVLTSRPGRD